MGERKSKVINIVSGKGGSGKSLLTAVLGRSLAKEGLKVVLVDLDIFVRGLTILLAKTLDRPIERNGLTTSELFIGDAIDASPDFKFSIDSFAIERFMECDLLPSVSRPNQPWIFDHDFIARMKQLDSILGSLLGMLREHYDYVIIDNRAGIDWIVMSTCTYSDIVLSVTEDDDVALQTNKNLLEQLRKLKSESTNRSDFVMYYIKNKARGIRTYEEFKEKVIDSSDYDQIGVIPFDAEVMEKFGTLKFWLEVNQTLFCRCLLNTWNNLAGKEFLDKISTDRYNFAAPFTVLHSRFSKLDRYFLAMGSVSILASIFGLFHKQVAEVVSDFGYVEGVSLGILVIGIIYLLLGIMGLSRQLDKH